MEEDGNPRKEKEEEEDGEDSGANGREDKTIPSSVVALFG